MPADKNHLQVSYYSLCMSLPSFTALKRILLCFLGAKIFQINILSLKSAARHLQLQTRERPQCCLQKHSDVFSKFQSGLPFVHHPSLLFSPILGNIQKPYLISFLLFTLNWNYLLALDLMEKVGIVGLQKDKKRRSFFFFFQCLEELQLLTVGSQKLQRENSSSVDGPCKWCPVL